MDASELQDLSIPDRITTLKKLATVVYSKDPIRMQLVVAQAILESSILKPEISGLALYNNLFGIKGAGTKGITIKETTEVHNGHSYKIKAEFASNRDLQDSFEQHRRLLLKPRYKPVMDAETVEEAAKEIRLCGYATDPDYTNKLLSVINHTMNSDFGRFHNTNGDQE